MRQFTLCFVIFALLTACHPATDIAGSADTALILADDDRLQLQLSPSAAPVETPLQLILSAERLVAVSGEVIGVSMYMGRIPLQFNQHNGNWQAEFLLGACSEPAMLWQVELELTYASGEKHTVKQQFHSSWQ